MARDDLDFTTGDVTGTAVQAHTIHGNVYLQAHQPAPPSFEPPRNWADAAEPPAEIQSLLWAQVQAAHQLPYQLPGARKPSLDTVYVRQDLGNTIDEPDQPRPAPVLDDDGRLITSPAPPVVRLTVRPPSRTIRDVLDGNAHLLVTGGPGQGKSTLTLRLAADIAQHWWDGTGDAPLLEPVVPLRLTARTLAARLDAPFPQALADSVISEYGPLLREPVNASLFAHRAVGCRWLLLVDAVDEVADTTQRLRLVNALVAWASTDTHRILLTTRPLEGDALAPLHRISAVRYELQPFDDTALRRFAANWFAGDEAGHFLRQIREAHLDELVRVPLLATIAAIIFGQYGTRPLPASQYSLYETYLAYIRRSTPDRFDRVPLLEHLARTRMATDTSLLDAARAWITERGAPDSPSWQDDLTAYLLAVGPFVMRGDDLAFIHHSFAEHLAATSLARELPESFCPKAFADLLHAADPREAGRFARAVLLHHARLHPGEADRLLEWLHQRDAGQHLLAARLLAGHLPATAAKTEDFLATVWGWAMTTHHHAADILSESTRATRHPGLVAWLVRLMSCVDAPLRSRAEAATALAVRVRGPHTEAAVSFLRQVVDEPEAAVPDRLVAAEALAQSGAGERDAAERGLRAVLDDPNTGGDSCRVAAVLLSAFGEEARAFAVATLKDWVSHEDVPPADLADVTLGLLEIAPESAEVCADVFRSLLTNPARAYLGWHDAAAGLASMGPDRLDEAVCLLTELINDRQRPVRDRVTAARALRELGPRQWQAAGELVLAAVDAAVRDFDRTELLGHLVTCGPAFHEAALVRLRAVLAEPHQNWNNVARAAGALAKIGPAFRDEAAERLLASGSPPGTHDRVTLLEQLVDLGEPYRTTAMCELQDLLADPDVHHGIRCRAASKLIDCGPGRHAGVIEHLRHIAATGTDPEATTRALQELVRTSVGDKALDELLVCAGASQAESDIMLVLANSIRSQDGRRVEQAAELLRATARDSSCGLRTRLTAASGLSVLSCRFDRESAVELRRIVESDDEVIRDFPYIVNFLVHKGRGPAGVLAEALFTVLRDARTDVRRLWNVVQALGNLGHRQHRDVVAALRSIAEFPGADDDMRVEAAVLLAERRPEHLERALTLLVEAVGSVTSDELVNHVGVLESAGADVRGRLRALLSGRTAKVSDRLSAAEALSDVTELRSQAHDDRLGCELRASAFKRLVAVDRAALPEATTFLLSVVDDQDASLDDRGRAVWTLAALDRRRTAWCVNTLWRHVDNPDHPASQRAEAAAWLNFLLRPRTSRYVRTVMDIIRHPDIPAKAWRPLIADVPRRFRTELERDLLRDRTVSVKRRLPSADVWDDLPLRAEVAEAMRDEVTAPEISPGEQVQAAVALADLSATLADEAVSLLDRLVERAPFAARKALATISPAHWWRVHDEALGVVKDTELPFRTRFTAARLLDEISAEPCAEVLAVWRAAPSWMYQVDGHSVAGDVDALRRTRDDPHAVPAARRRAAKRLYQYTADDRAAAVRVLAELATDRRVRPPLRWRAAWDLGECGTDGRERAAVLLRAMAEDEELQLGVRAEAAWTLANVKRTTRQEAVTILFGLLPDAEPLRRVHVLRLIGEIDSMRVVPELQAMGMREPSPVVRMWCARALVELRRDQREKAAVIARAVAFDHAVPKHVRRRAAGDLARWSELMRVDARDLIRTLTL